MRPSGSLNSVVAIRPVAAVIAAEFMRTFTRSAAWIFMPLYLERVRHIPPYGFIGLIFTVASMAAFPFALLGGNLIDRLGSRKILLTVSPLLSIVFFSMSFLVYSEAGAYTSTLPSYPLSPPWQPCRPLRTAWWSPTPRNWTRGSLPSALQGFPPT